MKTIWKFELEAMDRQFIDMPALSEVLCVQVQDGKPCVWAMVEPKNDLCAMEFRIYGTGHPIDNSEHLKYIGSYQLYGGTLVFHCFEA